jgi:HTH-type transcriptional regulator/antitoxin MqsA
MQRFEHETFVIERKGLKAKLDDLSGWRCPQCDEIEFDAESARRYAAAGDDLVIKSRRRTGEWIRRIRKKLNLTQAEAAWLTGGGHNAFSRYERAEVEPLPAVINLFRLLDKHPDLLKELSE